MVWESGWGVGWGWGVLLRQGIMTVRRIMYKVEISKQIEIHFVFLNNFISIIVHLLVINE